MKFPGRRPFNSTLLVGNGFFLAAMCARWLAAPDGVTGVLFGVTIGCFIVGLRKMRHEPPIA